MALGILYNHQLRRFLASIAVTTVPSTTTYAKSSSFNPAGMVVTATYLDGTNEVITGYTYTPTTLNTVGNQNITISYTVNGTTKTTTTSVTVKFLPLAYQQVEYVQNTANVIIDTGFIPNQNTRVTARVYWPSINSENNENTGGFGAAKSYNSRAFETYVWAKTVNWNFYNKTYGADGGLGYTGFKIKTIYRIDANKNVYTIKDDNGATLKTITANNGTFTAPHTLYLFGSHRDSTLYGRIRFYDVVKIYDNGTLIRNMVPCYRVSDSTMGMYDTINNTFYARSNLTKGADVNTEV